MKKIILISAIAVFSSFCLTAQINMDASGHVAIGSVTPLSSYSFVVGNNNNSMDGIFYSNNSLNGGNSRYGIVSYLSSSISSSILRSVYGVAYVSALQGGQAYGVHGMAGNATSGYNVGVYGQLLGSRYGAGVYGNTSSTFTQLDDFYAGYFVGKVKITGTLWANGSFVNGSDERIKKNIGDLDSTDNIFKLQPKKYKFKSPKELRKETKESDTTKTAIDTDPDPDYLKNIHYGFLAQDLQKIYPDLVYKSGDGILGIDYIGLIPIIIDQLKKMKQSIKEQEMHIDSLKKIISKTKVISTKSALIETEGEFANNSTIISTSKTHSLATLDQNAPNPFNQSTQIGYYLPETVINAILYIFDMNGLQLKSIQINSRGKGSITINGSELNAGMYLYSLIVDGEEVDTKRMILTK